MAPSRKYIGDSSESAIDSDYVSVGHLPVLGSESTNSSSGFFFFFSYVFPNSVSVYLLSQLTLAFFNLPVAVLTNISNQ